MTIFHIKWEWTIPNLLSILRLLLLPVFVVLYLMSDTRPELLYWAAGVLVLSGLTDLFDGLIAVISIRSATWVSCWTHWPTS